MKRPSRHQARAIRPLAWGIGIGLFVGVATRALMSGEGEGSHFLWPPWRDPGHIESINQLDDKEQVCVTVHESVSGLPVSAATSYVKQVLSVDNPDEDWNGLNGGKIEFEMLYAGDLPLYPFCTGQDIRIDIRDDVSSLYTTIDDPAGCAKRLFPRYADPNSGHDEWGNLYGEFTHGTIYIEEDYFWDVSDRRRLVNHEVGHLLGLADGGPNNPDDSTPLPTAFPVPLPSVTQDPFSCSPPSIMHSYGCSDLEWPSFEDRFAVEYHIPDSGIPVLGGKGWFSVPY